MPCNCESEEEPRFDSAIRDYLFDSAIRDYLIEISGLKSKAQAWQDAYNEVRTLLCAFCQTYIANEPIPPEIIQWAKGHSLFDDKEYGPLAELLEKLSTV